MTEIKIGRNAANRITVSFPYNPHYIAKIKTIKGYRWHPEEKCWSFPAGNDILDRLASLFEGANLDIDPSLQIMVDRTNSKNFEDLRRELISRKYSPKTIKAYIHYNEDLLRLAKKKPADVASQTLRRHTPQQSCRGMLVPSLCSFVFIKNPKALFYGVSSSLRLVPTAAELRGITIKMKT